MPGIALLSPQVQIRIAAGEVIERPASIVKELVENSIDSGAKKIDVSIRKGGIDAIRVRDDGKGIASDEIELALTRHATSKISTEEELSEVTSMGFRGEALPSIVSVTQFTISSRTAEEEVGTKVICREDTGPEISRTAMAEGTIVEANNIFFNMPVRRKFLKTAQTECNHITRVMIRCACACPDIGISLEHNASEIIKLPAGQSREERISALFGKDIRKNLMHTTYTRGPYTIDIYGVAPAVTRSNSNHIYAYINNRYFRDKTVLHALREGYHTHIPSGRWPVVFAFIETSPGLVDVNVHPAKTEVRFRDPGTVHSVIKKSIERMFDEHRDRHMGFIEDKENKGTSGKSITYAEPHPDIGTVRESPEVPGGSTLFETERTADTRTSSMQGEVSERAGSLQHGIMQIYDSYILVEKPDKIIIYDQHALHEGIREEQLRKEFRTGSIPSQDLLMPEQIDLSPPEKERILSQSSVLKKFGFDIEDFAGKTIVIHAVPVCFDTAQTEEFILDILDILPEERLSDRDISDRIFKKITNRIACYSAVRAGQKLSGEEIKALLDDAAAYNDAISCAHGRPTSFEITKRHLEKQFHR